MGLKNLKLQYLAVNVMSNCIKDLRHWMISNNLMINESNTKLLLKHLSVEDTLSLLHALVTSPIDHCHSLLFGLPDCQLNKLQRVLNAAARLIHIAPKCCHVIAILVELHCLPVR